MKAYTRKILALILAMVLIMGVSVVPAFAVDTYSITLDNAVAGETYTAYKIFDVTYAVEVSPAAVTTPPGVIPGNPDDRSLHQAYSYTIATDSKWWSVVTSNAAVTATQVAIEGLTFTKTTSVNASGAAIFNVSYDSAVFNAADFAKKLNENKTGKTPAGSAKDATSTPGAIIEDLTIALSPNVGGYYFVDTSLGSLCSIDTTEPNAVIREKNTTTTVNKTVQEDSNSGWGDKNDADFGQTVHFKSEVVIGKFQKNVVYHDVISDKFELDLASIKVAGADITGHYTIYASAADTSSGAVVFATTSGIYAGDTFAVAFDDAWTQTLDAAADADRTYTITYDATLKTDAIVGDQTSGGAILAMGEGNDNKASVTYGESQRTEWDWTRTYTWDYEIFKYTDIPTTGTALADAHFNLKLSGTPLEFVQLQAGDTTDPAIYRLAVAGDAGDAELVTPDSGKILLQGLDADTYSLEEIQAPEGYNKLQEEVAVALTSNTTEASDGTKQANGALQLNGSADLELKVENKSGLELPATGGIGTTIFYIIGAILVLGAGVLLVTRRKMNK